MSDSSLFVLYKVPPAQGGRLDPGKMFLEESAGNENFRYLIVWDTRAAAQRFIDHQDHTQLFLRQVEMEDLKTFGLSQNLVFSWNPDRFGKTDRYHTPHDLVGFRAVRATEPLVGGPISFILYGEDAARDVTAELDEEEVYMAPDPSGSVRRYLLVWTTESGVKRFLRAQGLPGMSYRPIYKSALVRFGSAEGLLFAMDADEKGTTKRFEQPFDTAVETSANAGSGCFAPKTQVELAGGRTLDVARVAVGDMVVAFDPATRSPYPRRVRRIREVVGHRFVHVESQAGAFEVTADHMVQTHRGRVAAGRLTCAHELVSLHGPNPVRRIEVIRTTQPAFNLYVEEWSSFAFAGGIAFSHSALWRVRDSLERWRYRAEMGLFGAGAPLWRPGLVS